MNSETITRKAIDRKADIGCFYDAVNEQINTSDHNLFSFVKKNINMIKCQNYDKPKETFNCWYDCEDVFKTFGIEPDLTLSIVSGIFKSKFSDYLLSLNEKSLTDPDSSVIRFIFHKEVASKESKLNETECKASYFYPTELKFQVTHAVVGIKFGLSIFVSFDYKIKETCTKSKIELINEVQSIMKLVFEGKKLSYTANDMLKEIEFHYFDNYLQESNQLNIFSLGIKPKFYKTCFSRTLNSCLEFELVPVSHFKKFLEIEFHHKYYFEFDYFSFCSRFFQRLKLILYELSLVKAKTRKYADYFLKIEKSFESIEKLFTLINEKTCMAIDFIKCFRSSKIKKELMIKEIIENVEQKYSRFLKNNQKLEEKMKLINIFNKNGIKYLNKNESIPVDYSIKIVLFFNQRLIKEKPMVWYYFFGKFITLKMENNKVKYIVNDCDIVKENKTKKLKILLLSAIYSEEIHTNSANINDILKSFSQEVYLRSLKPKKEINIILLGESGVGKSTFVNAFYYYLKFDSLEEAKKNNEFLGLIGSKFSLTDCDFNTKEILIGPTENESFIEGQSSTQKAKAYEFRVKDNLVRLIDTPGMGDTRGISVDKKNFTETIQFLSKFDHLNGICFLIKPNNARLQPGFRYCFKELLAHLHRSSIENICFCFTSSRDTMYRPGDTLPALQNFLADIEQSSGLKIKLNAKNVFHTDNEAFRYLAIIKTGNKIQADEKVFANSWQISSKTSIKMLDYIDSELQPLAISQLVVLNETIKLNDQWAKPIVSLFISILSRLHQLSLDDINKKEEKKIHSFLSRFFNGIRNPLLFKSRRTRNGLTEELNKKLNTLIEKCAILSNMIRYISVALFNDELDAHLEEAINAEINSQVINQKGKTHELDLKEIRSKYKNYKIEFEKNKILKSVLNEEILNERKELFNYVSKLRLELNLN